jgi:hypothetical protein
LLQILKISKSLASISFAQHAATGAFGRRKNRIRVLAGDKVLGRRMI